MGENGHPCLLPYLEERFSAFHPFMMLVWCFLYYYIEVWSFYTQFWGGIFKKITNVKFCQMFLSASIKITIWFLSFILLMWCITVIDLQMLNHPCIPRMNLNWSWWMILLMYCWIQFPNILLRIFASIFIIDIGL